MLKTYTVIIGGVTNYAGLYFVGMPWMPMQQTGLLLGVGKTAVHIVERIVANSGASH